MPHACREEAAKSAMSIALPAEGVQEDEPLAYRSHGSGRAAALDQLALHPDRLHALQASRRGTA